MLPRVTMPRITLGKERQHRDKQHKASGVPVEKSIPSQPAWRTQFSCFRVIKQHCWWYTWILCVCRGQIQLSEALETHTQGSRCCRSLWAPDLFISAPCHCRELPAIPESFWKAQTTSFFRTLIRAFERCDSQGRAHPSLAHFPSPFEGTTIHGSGQHSWASLQHSGCVQSLQGDKAHSSLLGTPWFAGVTAALHWSTACWRNSESSDRGGHVWGWWF